MAQYNMYSIRTPAGCWLGYEGVKIEFPAINWVDCKCQRRVFSATRLQAKAFLAYANTVTPGCKLIRIGVSND